MKKLKPETKTTGTATSEKARAKALPTRSLQAWEAWQLGQQQLARRTSAGLLEAEKFYRKAVELDPGFALAYVGLGDSMFLRTYYSGASFGPTLQQAQEAIDAALKLDQGLAEAWAASGFIAAARTQRGRAEQMFRRALELDPNNVTTLHWYGFLQLQIDRPDWYGGLVLQLGRQDEALRFLEKAATLDPLSAVIQRDLGEALETIGRGAEAESRYRKSIEIDPSNPSGYTDLALFLAYFEGRFADAVPLARKAMELDPDNPVGPLVLTILYLDLDEGDPVSRLAQAAEKHWPKSWWTDDLLSVVNLSRGDGEVAARHAGKVLESGARNADSIALLSGADLKVGDSTKARSRYAAVFPELLGPEAPNLDGANYQAARNLFPILQKTGEVERATLLLDRSEQFVRSLPRLPRHDGLAFVALHALRGQRKDALAALRAAEKAGWRGPAWRAEAFNPAFESIRDEPEFKAVFADIERDMARQRALLAARPKHAPLLPPVAH